MSCRSAPRVTSFIPSSVSRPLARCSSAGSLTCVAWAARENEPVRATAANARRRASESIT